MKRARDRRRGVLPASGLLVLATALARGEISVPVPTDVGGGVTIKISSPVLAVPRFGFMPVRVSVENLTTSAGTWRFRFDAGNARVFPGLASTTFELEVPATRNREAWFYVPLAEPGISINPALLAATPPPTTTSASTIPLSPTPLAGVYPDPKIPGVTFQMTSAISSAPQGLTRTFTITQSGPANALPPLPRERLPANASSSVARRESDGLVTRTTTIPMTISRPGTSSPISTGSTSTWSSSASPSPSVLAMTNARNELTKAGLHKAGIRSSSSVRSDTAKPGMPQQFTVTIRQSGPAASLPVVDAKSLPPGFTSVNLAPDAPDGSTVVREFTYVESIATSPTTTASTSGTAGTISLAPSPGGTSSTTTSTSLAGAMPFSAPASAVISAPRPKTPSDLQAEARRVLRPTGLLDGQSGVRTNVTTAYLSLMSSGAPTPSSLIGNSVVLFEQTGPAATLTAPAASTLPPGVVVTVLPPVAMGPATRVISYLDPAVIAATHAHANTMGGGISGTIFGATNIARLQLVRAGFLRSQPGITISPPITRNNAGGSTTPGSPDLIILSETGAAPLLPEPPASALPTGITCTVTPAAVPGEVSRNFLINVPAMLASAGGTSVPMPTRTGSTPARISTGTMISPGNLVVEVSGPGIPGAAAKVNFPNNIANTAMPPMATTAALDAALRGKLAMLGSRTPPNLAAVDPALLPADWRVWSAFNAVLLKADEFALLDPARRAALRSWVAMGGLLFLTPEASAEGRTERVGAGRIEFLAESIAEAAATDILSRLQLTSTAPGMPERERMTLSAGTPMGDLVAFVPGDTGWISLLLVVFALLVGPVNVFFLAPARKRHRLFLTTPLLSLAGAIGLGSAIVLQDGLGGEGLRRTLVMLVPGENQAVVLQEQAARSGFLSRREFPLDDGTLCAVLPVDGNVFTTQAGTTAFYRDADRASGDWFRNRTRQAHLLRALAPTRARIELAGTAADGAPQVESTLATELRDFRLRDERGKIWGADSVPAGRRTTLRAESRFTAAATASLEAQGNGTANLNALLKEASTLTDSWQWVGRGGAVDIAPIATLPAIRWKDDPILYAGVAERPGRPVRPAAGGGGLPPVEKGKSE